MSGIFRGLLLGFSIGLFSLVLYACKEQKEEATLTHFPFREGAGGKWGLLRADGEICATSLFERPPSVVVNRRFIVPDSCGRLLLYKITEEEVPVCLDSCSYVQLGYFFGRRTFAQREPGGPFYIIDKEGRLVSMLEETKENKVERVHNFCDGLALVRLQNGKYGYADEDGKMIIPPLYDFASDFSEGMAVVGLSDGKQRMVYRILDKQGEVCAPIRLQQCDLNSTFVHGTLAYKDRVNGFCALLDKKGETVQTFPKEMKAILSSPQGVTLFLDKNGVGLVDSENKVVIPGSYERGKVLGDGRVAFRLHGKWGMLDFRGKALLEFAYDSLSVFYDKEHAWAYRDGSCRMIGLDGESVTDWMEVPTDKMAYREVPQVFYRNPQTGRGVPRKGMSGENTGKSEDIQEGTVASRPEGRAGDVQAYDGMNTGNDVSEVLPAEGEEMRRVSRENPFFEEARKVYADKLDEPDVRRRKVILDYMERFRMAYTQKNLPFIEQVFSEEALIVVGKVVKAQQSIEGNYLSTPEVQYNVKSKKEYLARLKEVFKANRKIRVRFRDFKIMRHPTRTDFYGVTMRQGYASDLYSDDGYLFLLWDFSDECAPKIHVRTWQPSMLDTRTPLPADKVFSIRNFNFE